MKACAIVQDDPDQHLSWLHKSCNYIRALYPAEHAHSFKLEELRAGRFFIVRHDHRIVGCGAMVPHRPTVVELKHIFIDASVRGLGYGKALLIHIEQIAWLDGVTMIVLETGDQQPQAIGLYQAFGYRLCQAYISTPLPHAIFMHKIIRSETV